MQKRYQVFVSSTYEDLKQERAEVMQALLELECMPAGMELFPASSEEQWSWIKKVIDESDYYIVVVAGRYGSTNKATGLSYTEMEYRYAIESGKPVIAFLHQEPEELPKSKCESSNTNQQKLDDFRTLCQKKLCKYWVGTQDLGAKVSRSITQLQKHHPSDGWIKPSSLTDIESEAVDTLKQRIRELEERLEEVQSFATKEFSFSNGNSEKTLNFYYELKERKVNKSGRPYWVEIEGEWYQATFTWDEILSTVGHALLLAPDESEIMTPLISQARNKIDLWDTDEVRISKVKIETNSLHRIRTQFIGRGLISVEEYSSGYGSSRRWIPSSQAKKEILLLNADLDGH